MPTFDFARPFQFVMQDPNWLKKVLLGAVFMFIPFVGIFVLVGYSIRIMRQVADGDDSALPEWDRFGEDLVNGLKAVFGAALGYIAPGIVLYILTSVVGIAIAAAMGNSHGGGGDAASSAVGLLIMGGSCISFALLLVGGLLAPIGVLRFVDTGEIGAAYRFGEVFAFIKENFVNILMAFVVGIVAGFIAQLGVILCIVGVFLTASAAMMIRAHAWGQVLKIARAKNGVPAPSSPNMAGAY